MESRRAREQTSTTVGSTLWQRQQSAVAISGLFVLAVSFSITSIAAFNLSALPTLAHQDWLSIGIELGCLGSGLLNQVYWYGETSEFVSGSLKYYAIRGEIIAAAAFLALSLIGDIIPALQPLLGWTLFVQGAWGCPLLLCTLVNLGLAAAEQQSEQERNVNMSYQHVPNPSVFRYARVVIMRLASNTILMLLIPPLSMFLIFHNGLVGPSPINIVALALMLAAAGLLVVVAGIDLVHLLLQRQ